MKNKSCRREKIRREKAMIKQIVKEIFSSQNQQLSLLTKIPHQIPSSIENKRFMSRYTLVKLVELKKLWATSYKLCKLQAYKEPYVSHFLSARKHWVNTRTKKKKGWMPEKSKYYSPGREKDMCGYPRIQRVYHLHSSFEKNN